MKLTKQEWCVVVMAVCLLGMAGAVVTLAGLWLWVNLPVLFWVAVYVGCAAVLMLIVTWRWRTEERHARRQEMHLCPHCGKLLTLGEYLGHTCHTKGDAMMLQQATMFGVRDERIKVKRGFAATGSGRGRHENSLAGHDAMAVELRGRRAEVMGWLRDHGPATDRQVRDGLYGPNADMNMVRPRISELLDARVIRELDRVEDASTGMQVRRVEVTGSGWKLY